MDDRFRIPVETLRRRGSSRLASEARHIMPNDFERNRRAWDAESDAYQARHAPQLARSPEAWGIWSLPESEAKLLGDVAGKDVLEYGCGAAEWAIALSARGARCTGLDNSERQLAFATRNVEARGADVALVHAPAERTPFSSASFDVVFCDHGAMSFADPAVTIPEVARLLRPGGILAFAVEHPIHGLFWDDAAMAPGRESKRRYFELGRSVDPQDGGVQFCASFERYVTLLVEHGFVIEKLLEPRPSSIATSTYEGFAPLAWARDLPGELMIRARLG